MTVDEYKDLKAKFDGLKVQKDQLEGEIKGLKDRKAEIEKNLLDGFKLTPEQLDERISSLEVKIDEETVKIRKKLSGVV